VTKRPARGSSVCALLFAAHQHGELYAAQAGRTLFIGIVVLVLLLLALTGRL